MDKKRIILFILFLTVTVGLGFLLYFIFFAPEPTQETPTGTTTSSGQLPTSQTGSGDTTPDEPTTLPDSEVVTPTVPGLSQEEQVSKIIDDFVVGASISTNGTIQFYNDTDGRFYRRNTDGTITRLSEEVFFNVSDVTWNPLKAASVIEYPDGSNIYYDFDTQNQVSLPRNWEEFSFTGDGSQITAKNVSQSPENQWIVMSDPNGENVRLIAEMGINADKVTINPSPNAQVIAFSATGAALGLDRQEILFIGQNRENFKSAIVEGRGFEGIWSPSGQQVLYSVHSAQSEYKPQLWVVNASGDAIGSNRRALNVFTWAHRCVFYTDVTAYCAVPSELEVGVAFAPTTADNSPDLIYKINIQTGQSQQITLGQTHYIEDMIIDDNIGKIYFTDRQQIGMFSIDI